MALMTVAEVAETLGVQTIKVERLARESLLVVKEKRKDGSILFDEDDVKRYQEWMQKVGMK